MTTPTQLRELADRVAKLTGGDREVDTALAELADMPKGFAESRLLHAPEFTASIDAAVAFAEAVLPGCSWAVTSGETYCYDDGRVETIRPQGTIEIARSTYVDGAATPALAIVRAVLLALAGREHG